ncbi:MAG: hypothetical protein K2X07_10705 [Caulobacteraceae bacterium]|nr:hypothetical protein [Caulobacteraceae bacterium]
MARFFAILVACFAIGACTTTDSRTAIGIGQPREGATVLLVRPDVQLALLTAAGLPEPRADWSDEATANLERSFTSQLSGSRYAIKSIDPESAMGGRSGQLLRLHEAVGTSIALFEYGPYRLPTKKGSFAWTLGEGASSLADEYGADYALFVFANGTYASSGRIATTLVLAAFGVSVPLGSQQAFVSLVDLRTGQIIWFNMAVAGPQADMRNPSGSDSLVTSLLKDAPL